MKLISVNVGLPREVEWSGGMVTTGIFKEPVEGPVRVKGVNMAGDGQADLSVHGGPTRLSTPIRLSITITGGRN
jgi:MOSC domain-containing protein YiiM